MENKIKVKLNKSVIGSTVKQKKIVRSLGITKINQVVEHNDTATIRGMVNKINHLVSIVS